MENLAYTLLLVLLAWRVLACAGMAALLAWALAVLVPAFTVGHGLALAVLGAVLGLLWQARAEAGVGLWARVEAQPVSKPVAFVGLALIGALWSGLLRAFGFQPLLIAALLLAASWLFAGWLRLRQRPMNVRSVWFAALSLLAGGLPLVWLLRLS